jgi:nitroreductase
MINENIYKRRSIVGYSDQPVPVNIIVDLFEAARWAPSAFNRQPWRFILGIKGTSTFNKILDALNITNIEWASNAPVLIATVAEVYNKDRNSNNKYAWHDTAMAYSNMVIHATENNLFFHPMAGFSSEKIIKSFDIPNEFEPVTVAALGYKSNYPNISKNLKVRDLSERTRKPVSEIVFTGKWGEPYF